MENKRSIDVDLAEYDQIDEFKLLMDNPNQPYYEGTGSKFLVTLSSCSDQASVDDTNCENDFVFLPDPNQHHQSAKISPLIDSRSHKSQTSSGPELATQVQQATHPLITLSNNGNNPFGNYQQQQTMFYAQQSDNNSITQQSSVRCQPHCGISVNKPFGLIEACPSMGNNANKLADLMQQIVARSDLIHIAIPCAYCQEPIVCPPSDISSWVNHMSKTHNCKICPICNRLIGLGPNRDVEIMRKHVIEHLDEEWLEKRASRVSFTVGLQQLWFSGSRCSVKDPRQR